MPAPPFLVTKVAIPPVRAAMVPRSPLIKRLDSGAPLVLLAAGAGFGKTTLLAAWARATHCPVAWLTLDEQDNDPTRFWSHILLALRTGTPVLGGEAVALLDATPVPQLPTILTSLLNELAGLADDVALILDDYHVIDEPAIHQSLAFVLDHAPACLHLVIASRVDPDLPLSRLRARGHLVEIRDTDLRLTVPDAADFLAHTMGLHLKEEAVIQLWQRTDGWIAGLQLAALALRKHQDPAAFVTRFSGSHRFILDYVQEEILERQPLSIQRFLLRTSVLTSLHADLCREVAGEPASQQMLEGLERANLFVVPLDEERRWYSVHTLVRSALLARLQASEPEQVLVLHRRAAAWYAAQQLVPEAVPHALASHDFALAAELIERFLVPQSWRNEYHTLRRWLGSMPDTVFRARPDLSFLYAQAIFLTSPAESERFSLVEEPLRFAEQGYHDVANQAGLASVRAARALLTFLQGDFPDGFDLAREALPLLPPADRQWRGLCLHILATEAVLSGDTVQAEVLLQDALALFATTGLLSGRQFATALLGDMYLARGNLDLAAHAFRQVLSVTSEQPDLTRTLLTDETGTRKTHFERLAWYGLAYLAYMRNALPEAQHALQEALAQGQFRWISVLTPGLLFQVRLLCAQGETEEARRRLVELELSADRPDVKREVHLCQGWLALQTGDVARAHYWMAGLTEANQPLAHARQVEEAMLRVRLRLARGQPEAALSELAPLLEEAGRQAHRHNEIQMLMLQALAQEASGDRVSACQTLLQTVIAARHEGYQRLFLEEGTPMEALLKLLLPDLREQVLVTFVRTLLRAFGPASPGQDAPPPMRAAVRLTALTAQERRVLVLLAEGASNQDIGRALVIGLSTAKKHVANLLGKLEAENRTQAVARAREAGLL
jgi:LuxR family maltose regulon positive regulatory protein